MHSSSLLESPIAYLKGVGPQRAELLAKELGIKTFSDLLHHYPFRHIDRSRFYNISEISGDFPLVQVRGILSDIRLHGGKRTTRMTARLTSQDESMELIWFRGFKWLKEAYKSGQEYVVFGKPNVFGKKVSMAHPEMEAVTQGTAIHLPSMQAVYNTTEKLRAKGLDSRGIGRLVKTLLPQVIDSLHETLPADILSSLKLPGRQQAIQSIHFPESTEGLKKAIARIKFEELFYVQLNLLRHKQIRAEKSGGYVFEIIGERFNHFYHHQLNFELTGAQKRVLKEIRSDTLSGKQMNRLLQGDVGSGKTVVALMSMLMALDNGFQACLMAPTEILAFQHYESLNSLLKGMDLKIGLLTGSTKSVLRRELLAALQDGSMHIVIGTHALIEEVVRFNRLGFVVIDEQHRFGVAQRARLWSKSKIPPHVLVMTATPIPRTLAMTLYGDLDVSVIDELPPGRQAIKTIHRTDAHRLRVFGFMREQIKLGRQVYVVYPLIQESESLDLKDLTDGFESIVREFPLPDYSVSIVHGKMKPADKDYEMQRFVKGETQIMVATTVIEVGINVPNATVMVIESAERFGLSQLHQLRGRVGRGGDQSYCILMSKTGISSEARKRLACMVETNDGFQIAETDLQLRGPGDIQGTQQSGLPGFKLANLATDGQIIGVARDQAGKLLETDPNLKNPSNFMVLKQLRSLYPDKLFWSRIS